MANFSVNGEPASHSYTGYAPTLLIHQSATLVKNTATLARLAEAAAQPREQFALITGTFLTAAAAAEAILSESAHDNAPELYKDKGFRHDGAPGKFKSLMNDSAPEQLERIWTVRTALCHSEPQNPRSGEIGKHMTVEGANAVARYVEELAAQVAQRYSSRGK